MNGRLWPLIVALGLATALASAAGIGVRATYGAQTTADEPQYLLSAISLAEDADLNIADELATQRWRPFHEVDLPQQTEPLAGGRLISPHNPLLPVLIAGPVAVAGWVGAKLALSLLAGVLAALLAWTAIRRFGVEPTTAALTTGIFALSAPLAVYGNQVYPELPAALAVTVAIAALTGPLAAGGSMTVAAAVIALPWLSVKYTPVALVLAVLALWQLIRRHRHRDGVVLALALVLAGGAYLVFHHAAYGGWTPYAAGDHFVSSEFSVVGSEPNFVGRSQRLLGLLTGRAFGLAAWQPAWLLLVPALAALARRRPAGWPALVGPLAAGWLTATFLALTMQGWWFPGRQVVVVLGCAVLAIAWAAQHIRLIRAALAVLGFAGVISYAWLVADGLIGRITWVVDFAATTNPWYRLWRHALPDYYTITTTTWVLHAVWIALAAAAAVCSWRAAGRVQAEEVGDSATHSLTSSPTPSTTVRTT